MARDVEVNGVVFSVVNDMDFATEGRPGTRKEKLPLKYISTCETENTPCWVIESETIKFTGNVMAVDGDAEEISKWRVGLGQNVLRYENRAIYENDLVIEETLRFGPTRDGEGNELPFGANVPAVIQLKEPVQLNGFNSYNARWAVPRIVDWEKEDANLCSLTVNISLVSWFMLARVEAPRKVVLLGKTLWHVFCELKNVAGILNCPSQIIQHEETQMNMANVYGLDNAPAIGKGAAAPDLRAAETASANCAKQGKLLRGEKTLNKWVYDKDDCAIKWMEIANPEGSANWLAGK